MRYFFTKLLPPRPDFMYTMTEAERAVMGEHAAYWQGFAEKGWAVAYGPVADKEGGYGAGFWALPDDVDPNPILADDPTIRTGAGFHFEVHPMPALVKSTSDLSTSLNVARSSSAQPHPA